MQPQRLIGTDRGKLSLVLRDGDRLCLRRCLSARVASRDFRHSLDELAAALEASRPARVLRIVGHQQTLDDYAIDYALEWDVQTLPEYFARSSWLKRLRFVADALVDYEQWRQHLPPPIGLHSGRLVACRVGGGHWKPYLAPCPQPLETAYNLLGSDPAVLASLAPERVRGVAAGGEPEDVYAAGALVLQAFGALPQVTPTAAGSLELQARSILLPAEFAPGMPEPALRQIPYAEERIGELEQVTRRAVHFDWRARPVNLHDLRAACDRVLLLDSAAACSVELENQNRLTEALRLIEWRLSAATEREALPADDRLELARLAATYSRTLGLADKELHHLEEVVRLDPRDHESARRRWRVRYEAYLGADPPANAEEDAEGSWLLAELERLRIPDSLHLIGDAIQQAKEEGLSEAMIHGRRGDLHKRASALYRIIDLDYQDIETLLLYGLSLRELADRKEVAESYRQDVLKLLEKLFNTVCDRMRRLELAGSLDSKEVKEWTARFQFLLLS